MSPLRLLAGLAAALLAACGGGGGGAPTGDDGSAFTGLTDVPAQRSLSADDVSRVLAQAAAEAQARSRPATIAVVDRVGNVLAVFEMTGAVRDLSAFALATAQGSGLDGLNIPAVGPASASAIGAIAKAVTGAYLSSSGNAFSTRTASQIVQENFNPGELNQPGGPLFGVQFSSLPCSDLVTRQGGGPGRMLGPNRTPLGLSADPGGLPLYKDGVVVGGVGVIADGVYGLDRDPRAGDADVDDEQIALAATVGFLPPPAIEAPQITVEGKTLRYTDRGLQNDLARLRTDPAAAPSLASLVASGVGAFASVTGYYDAAAGARAGVAYGAPASGYVLASSLPGNPFTNRSAFVLVDGNSDPRFPPRPGTDAPGGSAANRLTAAEVTRLIDEALGVALAGRGQIRRPIGSRIHVSVSIVDTNGAVLGLARTPDGPLFGTDVSLQKARSAMYFSSARAANELTAVPAVDSAALLAGLGVFLPSGLIPDPIRGGPGQRVVLNSGASYVAATDAFVGAGALRGATAFSERGIGNLARPFYPDGINRNGQGPLSRPIGSPDTTQNWSPFSTGLQFDLVGVNILQHVLFILGALPDTDPSCTMIPPRALGQPSPLANGLQIFAGAVPIYRGGTLVGAIGVSGDGIDQDDMVASLGLRRAALALGGFGHAPSGVRSDQLAPQGVRLRYVSCPFGPFLRSDAQNVCEAL